MKGNVVIVGRPVGIVSEWAKNPESDSLTAAVPLERELIYEPEADMDELRAREEACWEGCDEA